MQTFLRDIKIKGIKNLKEPIELTFAKKEIKSFSELKNSNIKAIYGPNGSGKTAIVHAFNILQDLAIGRNYLQDSQASKKLFTLMNKECKTIEISANFFYEDDAKKVIIYTYEATITYNPPSFQLTYEKYSYKTGEYNKENILILTKDGKVIEQNGFEAVLPEFTNLLDKSSFFSLLINHLSPNIGKGDPEVKQLLAIFRPYIAFWVSLFPLLDIQDTRFTLFFQKPEDYLREFNEMRMRLQPRDRVSELRFNILPLSGDKLPEYEKTLKQKEKFLKIFKPNVKKLSFEKTLSEKRGKVTFYDITEYVEYTNYKIDLELESVGIKKLLNLFEAVTRVNKGHIVIIDELDSHINDVYLIRLLDYILQYSRGQLIFTTHNVSPMNLLKGKKHAIDFISISGTVTRWVQIGNHSPSDVYHRGMIKKLPFNVTAESFLGVFANDE